jgi:hypothetical protein
VSTPVLEIIAAAIETVVNGITVAADYNQTLTARRPRMVDLDQEPISEGMVLIEQDSTPEETENPPDNICETDQMFWLHANTLTDADAESSIDTRRNTMYADIKKAIMLANKTGSLQNYTVSVFPQMLFKDENGVYAGVTVPVSVIYRTKLDDPFTAM